MSLPDAVVQPSRDPRLDLFRGWALLVIFVGHLPMNPLAHFAPGRFGFSDSAEVFVFCSGLASALAYAPTFDREGAVAGSWRIAARIWQLYWAHIAVFIFIVAANVQFDMWAGTGTMFVNGFNHGPFLSDASGANIVALLTLRYVPHYFDILPMYIVLLALVPVVMMIARVGKPMVIVFVLGLWMVADTPLLQLPAEPWSNRVWFFDPFAWQLIFFLGFAFGCGWLPPLPRERWLLAAAVAFVVASVPLAWSPLMGSIGYSPEFLELLSRFTGKTDLGVLRIVHFSALAYVAYYVTASSAVVARIPFSGALRKMGRQTLAVFIAGQFFSVLGGFMLQQASMATWAVVLVNAGGALLLYLAAWVTERYKANGRPQAKAQSEAQIPPAFAK